MSAAFKGEDDGRVPVAHPDGAVVGRSRRFIVGVVSGVVALAAVLRWYMIGRSSIWIDEGASITLARMPWDRFLRALWQYEANMTSYYLILRAWMHLGDSETVVRSLSALLGTASVLAIFFLGRRLLGERTGLLAAALLAVNMFHVWFSQEARSYSLVVLLVIGSLFFFIEAVENPRKRWMWRGYVAVSVFAAYSHLYVLLVLAAQWLAVGPCRLREIGSRRLLWIVLFLGVPLIPLPAFVLFRDRGQLEWIPPVDAGSVISTLLAACGFNPLMLLLVLVGLVWTIKWSIKDDQKALRARLLGLAFVFPIFIVALASFIKPLLFFRHFAICIPPAALIAARVLSPERTLSKGKRVLVSALAVVTIGLSFVVILSYFQNMCNWGGDWRSATEHILANRQAGDAMIFHYSAGLDSYRYYEHRLPSSHSPITMPTIIFPEEKDLSSVHLVPNYERLRKASAGHPRLWVVLHQKEPKDLPAPFLDMYNKTEVKVFAGSVPNMSVSVYLYVIKGIKDH
jgi:mannosyltransferase